MSDDHASSDADTAVPGPSPPPATTILQAMPVRVDGYAPIRDYAAIGDGRTVALLARDGSVDWLCLPDLDSPSVFGALLDVRRGGRFVLAPDGPYSVERRYLPGTKVLETTFTTSGGVVRVTDAMNLPGAGLNPFRELARRVEGLSGRVTLRCSVEPRFGYGEWQARLGRRAGVPVATAGSDALAVSSWEAGEPVVTADAISGRFEARQGTRALVALCGAHQEPLVLPARDEVEQRLDRTVEGWARWGTCSGYSGPWREAVVRSALALKLLVYSPSGAVAAAATTSLPETMGDERNWDYRFCWVRDSAFLLDALVELGCGAEADAFFWWLMHASQLTHPRLQVLYRLNGGASAPERDLPLEGYRRSAPVRVGNAAVDQLQLDIYGDLLQTAWLYARAGRDIDRDVGRRLAAAADLVCDIWRQPDSGIWEVRSAPVHFTQSKMMCWVALDRALRLADAGHFSDRHAPRWRAEADAIRSFVERRCFSERKRSYVRAAGDDELDASLLLGILFGYTDPKGERSQGTIDALRRELGGGRSCTAIPGRTAWPGARAPSSPARSGWWMPWRERAGWTRRPTRWRNCSAWRTMWGSTPRRSTPPPASSWATSPRASPTSPW